MCMQNLTSLINKYKFNKLKAINFNIKSFSIKYKCVTKNITKQLKKLNNLIIANYNQQLNICLSEHIFNCYIIKNNCPLTYKQFTCLIKKHKVNKFELEHSYEIYSYILLKYISKTQDYTCFTQLLIKKYIIKKYKNVKKIALLINLKNLVLYQMVVFQHYFATMDAIMLCLITLA